jgi:hypothetical protein
MDEHEFSELELRVQIIPQQTRWPAPEYVHWQRLHDVANEARERVRNSHSQMDNVDRSANLSHEGKYRQRSEIAADAIAEFESSKTLARAREAVKLVVAKNGVSAEIAATPKAMSEAEHRYERPVAIKKKPRLRGQGLGGM